MGVRKIPPLGLFIIYAMVNYSLATTVLRPTSLLLDPIVAYTIAGTLGAVGVVIQIAAVVTLRRAQTTLNPFALEQTRELVTHGVYRFSRNPIYLGMAILLIAEIIALQTPWLFLLVFVFIWALNTFQIRPEEAHLRKEFPDAFTRYVEKTARWI